MRIAIAGTHFSGKTTLAEALVERLKGYSFVEEPYHHMLASGYEFADEPSVDDFAEQLNVSVALIGESDENTIFDRSPFDFMAYALSIADRDEIEIQEWLEIAQEALEQLDAIIFCPIETPDRIPVPRSEDKKLRLSVDQKLREFIVEDSFDILGNIHVLEVSSSIEKRLTQIFADIKFAP